MYPQPPSLHLCHLFFALSCVASVAAVTTVVIFTFEVGTAAAATDAAAEEAGNANDRPREEAPVLPTILNLLYPSIRPAAEREIQNGTKWNRKAFNLALSSLCLLFASFSLLLLAISAFYFLSWSA